MLAALERADPSLGKLAPYLDPSRRSRAWNDAKVTAHHGIIPTGTGANLERLQGKPPPVTWRSSCPTTSTTAHRPISTVPPRHCGPWASG